MKARLSHALAWATSRQGMHDIGVAVAAVSAIYNGLHRAGVL